MSEQKKKLSGAQEKKFAGKSIIASLMPVPLRLEQAQPFLPFENLTTEKCRYCGKNLDHRVTITISDFRHDSFLLKACCDECKSKILEFQNNK